MFFFILISCLLDIVFIFVRRNSVLVTHGSYRNFRLFTRTANYPHRPIIACGEKESQQITRTGG